MVVELVPQPAARIERVAGRKGGGATERCAEFREQLGTARAGGGAGVLCGRSEMLTLWGGKGIHVVGVVLESLGADSTSV